MGLKRISMAGSDVVVTDGDLADLVQEYAMELGRAGTTDIVALPDISEGHVKETRLLIGPASQIAVAESDDTGLDPMTPSVFEKATAEVRQALDRITGRAGGALSEGPETPSDAFPDFDSY